MVPKAAKSTRKPSPLHTRPRKYNIYLFILQLKFNPNTYFFHPGFCPLNFIFHHLKAPFADTYRNGGFPAKNRGFFKILFFLPIAVDKR